MPSLALTATILIGHCYHSHASGLKRATVEVANPMVFETLEGVSKHFGLVSTLEMARRFRVVHGVNVLSEVTGLGETSPAFYSV